MEDMEFRSEWELLRRGTEARIRATERLLTDFHRGIESDRKGQRVTEGRPDDR